MNIGDILLGAAIGTLVALVLAIPGVIGELGAHGKGHLLLPDVHHTWGRRLLKDREVFSLGLLIHLLAGLFFGAGYPFIVAWGPLASLAPYRFGSVALYGLALYLIANLVLFPLARIGVFGYKEDHYIWLETFVTTAVLVAAYVLVVAWFQPSWFSV